MAQRRPVRKRTVRPDAIDFRDLAYRPVVATAPAPSLFPAFGLPVKDQEDSSACTGFSLSLVVEHLLRRAARESAPGISPYMLYSMARRYDEFPGSRDEGSSLRGALKGWHRHGACRDALWTTGVNMPPAPSDPAKDWWLDAVKRPLGSYYRIDTKQISDIHSALNEVGIVYASADTHSGWDAGGRIEPVDKRPRSIAGIFTIPPRRGGDGGHAFAIVGYDERGFLLQNSWGPEWGTYGYAILTYDDWLENAMDCWVAQLGVVTEDHTRISASATLRRDARGRVTLSASEILRNREISPFVVDMGNNGKLSKSGAFRTSLDDVRAIVDVHLAEARRRWKLENKPVDVCVYAHGGLVGEKAAATTASEWISLLYDRRIFPIFLMWETDLLTTIVDRIGDAVRDVPRPAGAGEGFWSRAERWWNGRLERVLAKPGTEIWGEMKQNALAISAAEDSGVVQLFRHFRASAEARRPVRVHLVGHSAGSIVHSHLVAAGVARGQTFESVSFLAPAVTLDTFVQRALPHVESGAVRRYQQFHLSEKAEEEDSTCGPYRRSLLWLVSESFEGGKRTPILGMQKYFDARLARVRRLATRVAPGPESASTSHGGFDNDKATQESVVAFIKR